MKKLAIILAVLFGLGILGLGGCAVLLANGANEVSNEIDRQNKELDKEIQRQQDKVDAEVKRQQDELNKEIQRQQDEMKKQLEQVPAPVAPAVPTIRQGNPPMYGATHSCRELKNRGLTFDSVVLYWEYLGQPGDMDDDRDGIPCETVYGQR